MQIRQKYLNNLQCNLGIFSLKYFATFDISHALLTLIVAKLSTFKQVWFLLDPPVDKLHMKFSALNVDFDGPSFDFLGLRKPAHEVIKERFSL